MRKRDKRRNSLFGRRCVVGLERIPGDIAVPNADSYPWIQAVTGNDAARAVATLR